MLLEDELELEEELLFPLLVLAPELELELEPSPVLEPPLPPQALKNKTTKNKL